MNRTRTRTPMLVIVAAVVLGTVGGISIVRGAPITLQDATATFSQAGFTVSQTIDGSTVGGGWALSPDIVDQTAAWESLADVGGLGGASFTFTLYNNFSAHALGRFRISVTSDNRTTFADGLQSSGDVSATWTQLTPLTAIATGGPTLTILGDKSILASGTDPATTIYTVTATSTQTAITGFRLEALEDPSLPFLGPGRQVANGNFVLTEFEVDAVNLIPEPSATAVATLIGICTCMRRRRRGVR